MNLQLIKMELIEMLLSTKKAAVLKKVKAILEEEQEKDLDFFNRPRSYISILRFQ